MKSENGDAEKVGKFWEQKERHTQGQSPEPENSGNARKGTQRLSLVLKGSRKKTDSCSSFTLLLIDTGEVGA